MQQRFWSNPEFKKSLLITAIAACVAATVAVFYFLSGIEGLKNELIRSNTATAGILLEKHPEWKDDILGAFASQADEAEVKAGKAAAVEFGYNEGLPVRFIPVMDRYADRTMLASIALFLGVFLLFTLILSISHSAFYKKVRETASSAEHIVDGDFSRRLEEGEEGDLSKLAHQFNQMAQVLELSIEQLKKEKTYLKNMISDISHQLKTPLSSIKVYNEILQNASAKGPEEQMRFLKRTGEQIERMEWLVKNLLLLARLESGVTEFQYDDAPVCEVLENAVEILRDKWEAGGIELELSVSDREIRMKHDPSWLAEAVCNIVKNSIEHTPGGGHIRIAMESSPVMIRFLFQDDGEGISSTDLPHIFQRFYKGREKTAGSGTGIGLALAKAIIENHGGIISVESKKGSGTTFTVTFHRLAG